MKLIVYPYKMSSQSSKVLAGEIGALRVYPDRNYRPKEDHLIINWGNSTLPRWITSDTRMLNPCQNVALAANKLKTFTVLKECNVNTPEWTTDYNLVIQWLQENENQIVYGREKLSGHSGQGIKLIRSGEEVPPIPRCPLYTKQLKFKKEFRVHVFCGSVIDVAQKRRREGVDANPLIHNLDNGWVFTRQDMIVPDCVTEEAIKAVDALGLDFGAVDIAWNETQNKAFVFEVNTACGLQGTTIQKYKEAILAYSEGV